MPGKAFTGFLMEIIERRWTIFYALAGSLPDLFLMLVAHRMGDFATVVMVSRCADHGLYSALRLHRMPRLPFRAIPDGIAGARPAFWRSDGPTVCRRAGAVSDGTAHRIGNDFFRYNICRRGDRRIHPAVLR